MPTATPGQVVDCPSCGDQVFVDEWKREPRETTFDVPSWKSTGYRTYEPGPFADVKLSCGHEVHGTEGVRILGEVRVA